MRSGSLCDVEAAGPREKELLPEEHRRTLARVRWLADLFDDRFHLPGTGRRFGLDGILGLIPGIGDATTGVVSLYLAAEAWRLNMPLTSILRMGVNVGIDTALGAIPLLGDLFDFAWKANQKNVRLVLDHLERDSASRQGVGPRRNEAGSDGTLT